MNKEAKTGVATIVHAELNASSAYRWWNCPGSIRLIRLLPWEAPPTIYAQRGTAMHEAAAQWLKTGEEPQWALQQFNGFDLEPDEIEAVELYVTQVWQDQKDHGGDLVVEHRFTLKALREGMWGTNDAMLVRCPDGVLRVYDLKGGKGVAVEVEGNLQELYYAYGAILNLAGMNIREVELVIVQPRCWHTDGPVRRWRIDLIDTFDWSHDLMAAAARTDDPNAPLVAGDWCRFCPANGSCKVYAEYSLHAVALDFDVIEEEPRRPLPDPKLFTPEQMARLLPMLPILEDWCRLAYVHAHAEAEAGRPIPGHKLVAKRGRRQWTHDEGQIVGILTQLGLAMDQLFKRELKSPAQVEKLLRKADRPVIAKIAAMFSSGTNLVVDSDPRPAIEATGADVFSVVDGRDDEKD